MATDSPPLPNALQRAAALSDARLEREQATTRLFDALSDLATVGGQLLELFTPAPGALIDAFKRGVRYRETTNAQMPADAEILADILQRLRGRR